MKKSEMIAELEKFPGDPEVCIVVAEPNNAPYRITAVESDDFNEVDRIAIVTKLEEVA